MSQSKFQSNSRAFKPLSSRVVPGIPSDWVFKIEPADDDFIMCKRCFKEMHPDQKRKHEKNECRPSRVGILEYKQTVCTDCCLLKYIWDDTHICGESFRNATKRLCFQCPGRTRYRRTLGHLEILPRVDRWLEKSDAWNSGDISDYEADHSSGEDSYDSDEENRDTNNDNACCHDCDKVMRADTLTRHRKTCKSLKARPDAKLFLKSKLIDCLEYMDDEQYELDPVQAKRYLQAAISDQKKGPFVNALVRLVMDKKVEKWTLDLLSLRDEGESWSAIRVGDV